jgi:hypothetical protein
MDKAEQSKAHAALRANYRLMDRLYDSAADRLPVEPVYLEISCADSQVEGHIG